MLICVQSSPLVWPFLSTLLYMISIYRSSLSVPSDIEGNDMIKQEELHFVGETQVLVFVPP